MKLRILLVLAVFAVGAVVWQHRRIVALEAKVKAGEEMLIQLCHTLEEWRDIGNRKARQIDSAIAELEERTTRKTAPSVAIPMEVGWSEPVAAPQKSSALDFIEDHRREHEKLLMQGRVGNLEWQNAERERDLRQLREDADALRDAESRRQQDELHRSIMSRGR